MTKWQPGIPEANWDDQLFKNSGPFTQSSHWAAVQSALGRKTFFAKGEGWQCLAIIESGQLGDRIYCPYGPVVSSSSGLDLALSALKHLAKQEQVSYIRIEPSGGLRRKELQVRGLRPAPKDIQPRYTWVTSVTSTEQELLMKMTSTNRNLYNTAAKKGIQFKQSTVIGDLPIFLDMMHEVAKLTGITPYSDKTFQTIAGTLLQRDAAKIYIATHKGKPVASALVYDSPTTRYYAHAASYREARKLAPGSPLVTTMMFDAKKRGQEFFDFFGIAPPNEENHKWSGFTHFKKSFGGSMRESSGTWELPVKPIHYVAYRLAHKAKGLLK